MYRNAWLSVSATERLTAHIAVPAMAPADLPATLSPAILTELLRKQLGFKGLVVTDALEMAGIAQGFHTGEACVRALEAGADTLLMPTDPDAAIRAVLAAQQSGRLTRQRVQESVVKILSAKERVGLDKKRFVDVESIGDIIDTCSARYGESRRALVAFEPRPDVETVFGRYPRLDDASARALGLRDDGSADELVRRALGEIH